MSKKIVICGGGMSGLSLAVKLVSSKVFFEQIIIIEPETKDQNDRTWAFWEKGTSFFDNIVYRKWQNIDLISTKGDRANYKLDTYNYKLIRGIDFYTYCLKTLNKDPRVSFIKDRVLDIHEVENTVHIKTAENEIINADLSFDSITKLNLGSSKNINYLQHFYGRVLKADEKVFNTSSPEIMNFGVPQKSHECHFIYIIPISETEALVEYTIFSENLFSEKEYKTLLNTYLQKRYKDIDFNTLEEEFGVIPMSNAKIPKNTSNKIIKIGTAAGSTHPATGYTFYSCQKHIDSIISDLEQNQALKLQNPTLPVRHLLYASTLLNVLKHTDISIADFFYNMFKNNGPENVFDFLGMESTFTQEIKIMSKTPLLKFGFSFLKATKHYFS